MKAHPDHPNLTSANHDDRSESTRRYNCLAWAAGEDTAWWEPDEMRIHYWPDWAPREYTLDAHLLAFRGLGYQECATGELEAGYEKIAFLGRAGQVKHAARQLPNGRWTSKMGRDVDIEHDLEAVSGGRYGLIIHFLKRPMEP